jgi:hypothetical protein
MSRRAAAAGGDSWQRGGWRRWPLRRQPVGGWWSGSKGGGWDERRGGGWDSRWMAALAQSRPRCCSHRPRQRCRRHRPPLPPSWPPSWSQPTLASAIGQQKSHRQLHQQCHKRITAISPVAPSRPIPPSPLHVSPAVFFRPPPPPRSGERRLKPERGWREGDWGGRTRRIPCGLRPTLNSRCSASARRPHRIVSILGGG